MRKRLVILGISIIFALIGCNKKGDSCEEDQKTASYLLDYPDTVNVSEAFPLVINYVVDNSCDTEAIVDAKKFENTLEITLTTKYIGCNCESEFQEKKVSYPVIFDEVNTYTLKLWVDTDEYDTYTIVAQ